MSVMKSCFLPRRAPAQAAGTPASGQTSTLRPAPPARAWPALLALCLAGTAVQAAPKLRYKFEASHDYVYEVKIVATLDDTIETRQGLTYLTGKAAGDDGFTLRHSGNLGVQRRTAPDAIRAGRRPFPPFFPGHDFSFPRPGDLTITPSGHLVKSESSTALPYLLGDLEVLCLEEFPADGQSKWEHKREVVIEEKQASRFRGPVLGPRGDSGVKRTAHEITTFSIKQTTGNLVHIRKEDSLRSEELVDGNPKYLMTGEGELVFDLQRGLLQSQSIKYTITLAEKNLLLKIPVTVDCRLLDGDEVAKRREEDKQNLATAQAAAAKANEPKAFGSGEREKLLRDLKDRNEWTVRAAADRLAKAPADDHPEEIAAALAGLLSDRSNLIRTSAAKALVTWATAANCAALRPLAGDSDLWLRQAVMQALARFPTAENAEAVAGRLVEMSDRGEAGAALRKMGPVAEPAVLVYLKDRDGWVRLEACKVLADIGTSKSLPALETFGASGQGFDKPESEKAIRAIQGRQ